MTASPDEELAARLLDADDPRHVEARKLANAAILRLTRERDVSSVRREAAEQERNSMAAQRDAAKRERDAAGERERELREALRPAGMEIVGPNTISGPPSEFWPPTEALQQNSNSARVAIWFKDWYEASAFCDCLRAINQPQEPSR